MYENSQNVSSFDRDLTVWVLSDEFDVLQEVNDLFEAEHKVDIHLEVVSVDEVYAKLLAMTDDKNYPDIVTVDHVMISEFVNHELIEPLNKVFESLEVLPTAKPGLKVKGDYYGVPYDAMTDILYYNKMQFPDGISTFEMLDEESLALDYKNIYHLNPFLTGYSGYIVGINNFGDTNFYDIGLNREESMQGFMTLLDLIDEHVVYRAEGDIYDMFLSKEADLLIAPASMMSSIADYYPNLGYQAIPNFVETYLPYTYMTMNTYQLTALSKDKELATQYLNFLVSEDVSIARYEKYNAIAPFDYEEPITQDDYYTIVKKQLHRAMPLPNQIEFNQLYIPFRDAIEQIVSMPDQMQAILDNVVVDINKAIELISK